MDSRITPLLLLMLAPAVAILVAFFLLPLARLTLTSVAGPSGVAIYVLALATPRYLVTLRKTVVLALTVTLFTLALSGFSGVFLTRHRFWGKSFIVSMLTFPLAFPGVVVGFMIILLVGRQGAAAHLARCLPWGR